MQRRFFLAEAGGPARDLLFVAACLRGDREAVGRPRKIDRGDWTAILEAKCVSGQRMGELGRGCDIAGMHFGGRDMLLASRKKDLRQTFLAAAAEVRQMRVGFDRPCDNFEVADAAELV